MTIANEGGENKTKLLGSYGHMIYKLFFPPNFPSSVFVTTQQDGTVRMYDLREADGVSINRNENTNSNSSLFSSSLHKKILLKLSNGSRSYSANSLAFDPLGGYQFVVGGANSQMKLYDIRFLLSPKETILKSNSNDGVISSF